MLKSYFYRATMCLGLLFLGLAGLGSSLKSDEEVIFFPTFGYFINKNHVRFEFHPWVFEKEENSIKRAVLIKLLEKYFKGKKYFTHEIFPKRARAFLCDNERGKQIKINFAGKILELRKTGPDGQSISIFDWDIGQISGELGPNQVLIYQALLPKGDQRIFSGKLIFIPQKGFSVISDIDDTIKVTEVLNKDKLISNTFFKKFQAIQGMPQLYGYWSGQNAVFHYVSGSPWQLYPFLEEFLRENSFPAGTIHLKNFRMKISRLIQFLQADQLKYKIGIIEPIIQKFPERHFIFVGDSGEKDPEIYATLGRKYPAKVKLILIRNAGNLSKDSQRLRKIFPPDFPVKWMVFDKAEDVIIRRFHLLENLK